MLCLPTVVGVRDRRALAVAFPAQVRRSSWYAGERSSIGEKMSWMPWQSCTTAHTAGAWLKPGRECWRRVELLVVVTGAAVDGLQLLGVGRSAGSTSM
jgi:hypothetical protein